MKLIKYFVLLIICVSPLYLSAMQPKFYIINDKNIEEDSVTVNNPKKKPVFRVCLKDDLEKNILTHILNTQVRPLDNAFHNPFNPTPQKFPGKIGQFTQLENGYITKTCGYITLETILNKQTNATTIYIFNNIDSKKSDALEYSWSKKSSTGLKAGAFH